MFTFSKIQTINVNTYYDNFVCMFFISKRLKETKRDQKRLNSSFNRLRLKLMELSV